MQKSTEAALEIQSNRDKMDFDFALCVEMRDPSLGMYTNCTERMTWGQCRDGLLSPFTVVKKFRQIQGGG